MEFGPVSAARCTYCNQLEPVGTVHMCDPRILREQLDIANGDIDHSIENGKALRAEIERLSQVWNETEECLAAILNELNLPFQGKDEPMSEYQKRCIAALRAR
jgi:predicted  nucleic acid-binding Zn-ribbon protein